MVRSAQKSSGSHFGIGAISSLLGRCRQIVTKFAEDDRLSGEIPLPNHQISEVKTVLTSVVTMIGSLKNQRGPDEGQISYSNSDYAALPEFFRKLGSIDCTM